ncbi:SUMF1/EgtB/PvdO family nonheme iron enzyme [Nitrospinota bacterium]
MGSWTRFAAIALLLAGLAGLASALGSQLDRVPVSAAQFEAFLQKRGAPPSQGNLPTKREAAVNLNWHQASAYCEAQGKRLPSAQEWISACEAKEIEFPWFIWEWTTTDADRGEAGFKVLCGPGPSMCGCTHAYHTTWSNEVKGFRCAKPQPSVRYGN